MARRNSKLTLGTCCGVHILHDGLVDMLYALLPLLREAFGLSYAEVALIRAANKAAMAMFQIPAGLLAERVGERLPLALGTAIAGLGFIGLGFSTFKLYQAEKFKIPLNVSLSYRNRIYGRGNVTNSQYIAWSLSLFF